MVTVNNSFFSLRVALTWLRIMGLWAPDDISSWKKIAYNCYTFLVYMIVVGTFILIQAVDLCMIWGDIQLMTASAFVLFTNLTHSTKILNVIVRSKRIKDIVVNNDTVIRMQDTEEKQLIVKRCERGVTFYFIAYAMVTLFTILLWSFAAALETQDKQLPMRAWYPFNTSASPLYECAYIHQSLSLYLAASMNASKDILVTTLIAQCRCRLRLLRRAFETLCRDMQIVHIRLSNKQEAVVSSRMRACVVEHQAILQTVEQLQGCFSEPTFAQFTVSLVIICVTAFQLAFQTGKFVRMLSMTFYLMNMVGQVFIYCYEGNELTVESEQVCGAVYQFPWYSCSAALRRSALVVMTRCRRVASLTAAGFTTLSLASFVSICKASYSFFTVLKQMDEDK
ncbi:unnamed protein product [Colias eurytheme]|nr:unnamed protein product [Colias eurytheme]